MGTAINEGAPVADGEGDQVVEKFRPTSGRILGVIALAIALAVVVISIVDREHPFPAPVIWGALLGGSLAWSAMLRPRLWVTTSDLVMRNMASTIKIPLIAIEQIVVRQVVVVGAGERRFVSPAVGKSWRQSVRSNRGKKASSSASYVDFVDDRLHQLAEDARAQRGITLMSDEQLAAAQGIRREWAYPEIAALVVSGLGFVLSFFV